MDHALPPLGIDLVSAEPGLPDRLAEARPGLEAYARRLMPAGHSAHAAHLDYEDLIQDTLARALVWGSNFDSERPLLPWLKRTLLRVFLDHKKRALAAAELASELASEAVLETPGSLPHIDACEQVDFLLAQLDEPERGVMERFHRHEQSIAQIAAALDLPVGTVKSHLHRARRRLAERTQ